MAAGLEPFFVGLLAEGVFLGVAFGVDDFFAGVGLSDLSLGDFLGVAFAAAVDFPAPDFLAGVDFAGVLAVFGVALVLAGAGDLPLAGDEVLPFVVDAAFGLLAPFGDGLAAASAFALAGDSLALGGVFAPFAAFEGVGDFAPDVFFVGDFVFPSNFFDGVVDAPFFDEAGETPFVDLSGDFAAPFAGVALAFPFAGEPFDLVGVLAPLVEVAFFALSAVLAWAAAGEVDLAATFPLAGVLAADVAGDFFAGVVLSVDAFFFGVVLFLPAAGEEAFLAAFVAEEAFFDGVVVFPGDVFPLADVLEVEVFLADDLAFVGVDAFFGVFPFAGVVTICFGSLPAPVVAGDFLAGDFFGVAFDFVLAGVSILADATDFFGVDAFFAGVFFAAIGDFFDDVDDFLPLASETCACNGVLSTLLFFADTWARGS